MNSILFNLTIIIFFEKKTKIMETKVLVISLFLGAMVMASPTKIQDQANSLEQMESKLTEEMDQLNQQESIGIYGNMICLEKVSVEEEDLAEVNAEKDPLVRRIDEFLRSRKIQIKIPNDGSPADFFGRALGEKNIEFELRGLTHGASEGV